jgi:hypothetical protein
MACKSAEEPELPPIEALITLAPLSTAQTIA